jgi:hypothetical protein
MPHAPEGWDRRSVRLHGPRFHQSGGDEERRGWRTRPEAHQRQSGDARDDHAAEVNEQTEGVDSQRQELPDRAAHGDEGEERRQQQK